MTKKCEFINESDLSKAPCLAEKESDCPKKTLKRRTSPRCWSQDRESAFSSIDVIFSISVLLAIAFFCFIGLSVSQYGKETSVDSTVLKIQTHGSSCIIITDKGTFRSELPETCILFDVGKKYTISYLPWRNDLIVGIEQS